MAYKYRIKSYKCNQLFKKCGAESKVKAIELIRQLLWCADEVEIFTIERIVTHYFNVTQCLKVLVCKDCFLIGVMENEDEQAIREEAFNDHGGIDSVYIKRKGEIELQ